MSISTRVDVRMNPNAKAEALKAFEETITGIADKIFTVAQSKPKGEGITDGELDGFGTPEEIKLALDVLVRQGKLAAVPLFYSTPPQ